METSSLGVPNNNTGTRMATYVMSEDGTEKHIQRVALVDSGGGDLASDDLSAHVNINPTNDSVVITTTPAALSGYFLYNSATDPRYVKFYNAADDVDPTTDDPFLVIPLAAGGGAANLLSAAGILFDTGLTYRVTTGIANDDDTGPDANEVIVNLFYRGS